jgi:flagellar hook-basal body complex protein FliE
MSISQSAAVSPLLGTPSYQPAERSTPGLDSFGRVIDQLLSSHAQTEAKANQAVLDLSMGKTDDLHAVALAASMADLSFRRILEIRNRLLESYQEIMRMPV